MIGRLGTSLLFVFLLVLPAVALAGFQEEVARDLGVKNAILVAPAGGEWLIDLDAAAGVQVGDLLSVVSKGAPVVHPVTRQVIGSLDTIRAVLQVTKVKNGYSYASVIKADGEIKAGDEARRFAGLPAVFWDYTGEGEAIFTQLQGALPELNWTGYAAAQGARPEQPRPVPGMSPGLVFVLNAQGLGVKDQAFQPLRFYRPEQFGATPAAAPASFGNTSRQAAVAPAGGSIVVPGSAAGTVPGGKSSGWLASVTSVFGGSQSQPPGPGGVLAGSGSAARGGLIVSQMDSREGVWYGPRMEGKPVGVEVGDFDNDGKNETVLCFKDRLVVTRVVGGQLTPVADFSFGHYGEALTLDGFDIDRDGKPELYVSMVQLNTARSMMLELRDNKLQIVIKQIPWLLRRVDLPGEGSVLLAQGLNANLKDPAHEVAGPVFRVTRSGDQLTRGAEVSLPPQVELFGFARFDDGGRPLVATLDVNDKLQVLESGGGQLWESNDYFGGSQVSFERPDGTASGAGTRYAFLKPRLEVGPEGTVLVPVNEGSRTFSAFRSFNGSHLAAVSFDGYGLVERWRTKPQGGYLGDFRMADADNDGAPEIVMLVMFSQGGLFKASSGNSALLIYEMQ